MTEEYNGWTNYETWALELWLSNEESTWNWWLEHARYVRQHARFGQDPLELLATALRDRHRDLDWPEEINGTVYADLLGAALDRVNWREVAEAIMDAATEEED